MVRKNRVTRRVLAVKRACMGFMLTLALAVPVMPPAAVATDTGCSTAVFGTTAVVFCTFNGTGREQGGWSADVEPGGTWEIRETGNGSGTGCSNTVIAGTEKNSPPVPTGPVKYKLNCEHKITLLTGSGAVSGGDPVIVH